VEPIKEGGRNPVQKEEIWKSPSKFIHEIWMEESRTAYLGQTKVYVIDSEEYREGTYKKLDNRYPPEVSKRDSRVLLV